MSRGWRDTKLQQLPKRLLIGSMCQVVFTVNTTWPFPRLLYGAPAPAMNFLRFARRPHRVLVWFSSVLFGGWPEGGRGTGTFPVEA